MLGTQGRLCVPNNRKGNAMTELRKALEALEDPTSDYEVRIKKAKQILAEALASQSPPPTDDVRAGLELAARWHDEQAAKHAALQATAELAGGERQIGTLKVGAGRMIYSHDSLRRDHNEAAIAIRALSAQLPPAGEDCIVVCVNKQPHICAYGQDDWAKYCQLPPPSRGKGRRLLEKVAATFRRYEELHRAKGTEDAYEKSKANGALAHEIECFLNDPALASSSEGLVEQVATAMYELLYPNARLAKQPECTKEHYRGLARQALATPSSPEGWALDGVRECAKAIAEERRRYNEDSPTWRAFGFCIDICRHVGERIADALTEPKPAHPYDVRLRLLGDQP